MGTRIGNDGHGRVARVECDRLKTTETNHTFTQRMPPVSACFNGQCARGSSLHVDHWLIGDVFPVQRRINSSPTVCVATPQDMTRTDDLVRRVCKMPTKLWNVNLTILHQNLQNEERANQKERVSTSTKILSRRVDGAEL